MSQGYRSDLDMMREFADNLWRQDFQYRVRDMLNHAINGYKAEVVSNPGGNKLEVRFPFETSTFTFKCAPSMSEAEAGNQVLVECLGGLSNAFIRCYADFRSLPLDMAKAALTLKSEYKAQIPTGTDYNTLLTPGTYYTYSGADAGTMVHSPETSTAHTLIVMQSQLPERLFQISIANANSCRISIRYYNGTSFGSWVRLATT